MIHAWRLFLAGWILIIGGALLAHFTQTSGGIKIHDLRFSGGGGKTLSALLYVPNQASPEHKAPAVLAVHGYINSREVQSGFAIEFARRGYVVLALDQTGHGYSQGAAFSDGFGGPAALAYLRSLDIVDRDNIGLEGHSMGGWAVLAAAATYPDHYRAMVLEGSSTGAPFAQEGDPQWPRNLAVVFSKYDEFAELMWGTRRALDVPSSNKLKALFGTTQDIISNQLYGKPGLGTARILHQPPVTHPGNHISTTAIGHALDWFAQHLDGGVELPSHNQIWWRKELGTFTSLVGFVTLLLGSFALLLQTGVFGALQGWPLAAKHQQRDVKWWGLVTFTIVIPVLSFYPAFTIAETLVTPSNWLPQLITNQVVCWALANALFGWLAGRLLSTKPLAEPKITPLGLSVLISLATVAIGYAALVLIDFLWQVDFRIWFVGLKLLSRPQLQMALVYLPLLAVYFVTTLSGLHLDIALSDRHWLAHYAGNAAVLTFGFLVVLLAQYLHLFATGELITPNEPLNTIILHQFVPLMLIVSIISTFCYRNTGSHMAGALINSLWVTWYLVAGQATQFVS